MSEVLPISHIVRNVKTFGYVNRFDLTRIKWTAFSICDSLFSRNKIYWSLKRTIKGNENGKGKCRAKNILWKTKWSTVYYHFKNPVCIRNKMWRWVTGWIGRELCFYEFCKIWRWIQTKHMELANGKGDSIRITPDLTSICTLDRNWYSLAVRLPPAYEPNLTSGYHLFWYRQYSFSGNNFSSLGAC